MMKRFLTIKEAAQYLKIEEEELEKIVDRGKIATYKIGGVYTRFKVDELDGYIRRTGTKDAKKDAVFSDKVKDFFYYNDFYIFSCILIIGMLYFIFK